MSLSDFMNSKWKIDRSQGSCKAKPDDVVSFVNAGEEIRVDSSGDEGHKQCWRATSLHYDPFYDHLKGVMRDGEAIRYICIALDRSHEDGEPPARIHCYMSTGYAKTAAAPDDGTWSGGSH